jgi:exodeoxyribonuclease V alpha subunit
MENIKNPRLIMVGDKNQLPSVSPGNFLTDIIASKCANIVTLDKIHRQDENSFISVVANDVSKGKNTTIPSEATDIKWHDIDIDTFQKDIIDFLNKYIKDGKNVDDLQFISPMKKGSCGVFIINQIVQARMAEINNNQDKMLQVGFSKFYLGDRVMQIENNYEKDVFNGDMGKIIDLGDRVLDSMVNDKKSRFIAVDFSGKTKIYKGNEVDELMIAFCCTVHKVQGSQYKNVVMVMANEQQILISKELVYTGVTRGAKMVDIFGHANMLRLAPSRSAVRKRYTNVQKIIKGVRSGKSSLIELKTEKQEKSQ